MIVLVGESPNWNTVGKPHLWLLPDDTGKKHSANNLLKITGYTLDEYLRIFPVRTNVWTRPVERDHIRGRASAEIIRTMGDRLLVLGKRPAEVFGISDQGYFEWIDGVARCPHPSGRNRQWNDPEMVLRARRFFSGLKSTERAKI